MWLKFCTSFSRINIQKPPVVNTGFLINFYNEFTQPRLTVRCPRALLYFPNDSKEASYGLWTAMKKSTFVEHTEMHQKEEAHLIDPINWLLQDLKILLNNIIQGIRSFHL